MKKCMCLILALLLLSVPAFANGGVKIIVDGEELVADVEGEIVNGRTYVPLRAIAERLGAEIKWNGETRGIAVISGNREVDLAVGSISASVTVGERVSRAELEAAPYIKNGRTMVPLRFIAQGFGRQVAWSPSASTAVITQSRRLPEGSLKLLAEGYFSSVLPQAIKQNNGDIARMLEENPQNAKAYFSNLWVDEALKLLAQKTEKSEYEQFSAMSGEEEQYAYLLELGEKYGIPLECPVYMCPVNGGLLLDGPGQKVLDASNLCILKSVDGSVVCENLN